MNKFITSAALAALALTIGITSANAAIVSSRRPQSMSESPSDCKGEMGMLFRVAPTQIRAMQDQVVYISPVCEDQSLLGSNDVDTLYHDGNVTGLRSTIGDNDLLASVLYEKDYNPEDVVGIRFNRNSNEVILYVHKYGR